MSLEIDPREIAGTAVKTSLGFVHEFKQFISRGNVVDLAVGVIIGGAFGQITNSLVANIVMPPIGYLLSGVNVSSWAMVLPTHHQTGTDAAGKPVFENVIINFGVFLQACINFLIISFAIFLLIKAINVLKRKEAEKPSAPPVPSAEEKLLTEIRDLLAKGKS